MGKALFGQSEKKHLLAVANMLGLSKNDFHEKHEKIIIIFKNNSKKKSCFISEINN